MMPMGAVKRVWLGKARDFAGAMLGKISEDLLVRVIIETPIMSGKERRSHSRKAGTFEVENGHIVEAVAVGAVGVEGGGPEVGSAKDPDTKRVDAQANAGRLLREWCRRCR